MIHGIAAAAFAFELPAEVVANNALHAHTATQPSLSVPGELAAPTIALQEPLGQNPPILEVTAPDMEVDWYYQLDITTNGTEPDGTPDSSMQYTFEMAVEEEPFDWGQTFTSGQTVKARLRYGSSLSGPWSAWSNTVTDVLD